MPAWVDNDGRMLSDDPLTKPSEVERVVDEPLHIIAAKQHAKDSTKKDTNKQS